MPGPLAAQVVMWVGYLQRGPLGALGTSLIFTLPSFVLVLTVAFFYVQYQGLAVGAGRFLWGGSGGHGDHRLRRREARAPHQRS